MFTLGRRREIHGFVQALKTGAWDQLNAQLNTHRLPRRQDWRVALWKAAVPTSLRAHDLELRGCAWLRAHGMRLGVPARQEVMEHVMEQAHGAVLQTLLDGFGPCPGFPLGALLSPAIRRPDDKGLAWLHARQVPLDPLDVVDRPPALQWVMATRVLQPATEHVVKGLLDRGVRVRTAGSPRPLVVLLGVAERYDLSCPSSLMCAQRLWDLFVAAGDNPDGPDVQAALARTPQMEQWHAGRRLAAQRRDRAAACALPTRARHRA